MGNGCVTSTPGNSSGRKNERRRKNLFHGRIKHARSHNPGGGQMNGWMIGTIICVAIWAWMIFYSDYIRRKENGIKRRKPQ
jgi:hypothetical protein